MAEVKMIKLRFRPTNALFSVRWGGHRWDKAGDVTEVDEENGKRYLRDFPDNFELARGPSAAEKAATKKAADEKAAEEKAAAEKKALDEKAAAGPPENKGLFPGKDKADK